MQTKEDMMSDRAAERVMAYDGEGNEVGQITLAEARGMYSTAEYDESSHTITVGGGRIPDKEPAVSAYLAGIGRRGGQTKGQSKRRSPEHYRAAAAKSASVRRALRTIRERIATLDADAGDLVSAVAAQMGRKGGKAGRGASQRRSPEHYRAAAAKSASVRRALRTIRERIASLEPGHHYRAGCDCYDLAGRPMTEDAAGPAEIEIRLRPAVGGGVLLGVYEWARVTSDYAPMRYRPLARP